MILVDKTKTHWIVSLNRPQKRNALDLSTLEELIALFQEAKKTCLRCLLLKGEGPFFCSGIDLTQAKEKGVFLAFSKLLLEIHLSPFMTMALVQGGAFAGGLGLMAACDFAIASEKALFCLPEVRLGITPSLILPFLQYRVKTGLRKLLFLGEKIGAKEALQMGLIDEIGQDHIELLEKVLLGDPVAAQKTKELLRIPSLGKSFERALKIHEERLL